jgi:hypothetical protein
MNTKNLATMMLAVLLAANAAFGQTVTVQGQVSALTTTQITLTSGKDTWLIQRTSTTTVTSGTLAVGNTVTVQCASGDVTKQTSGDAQKKE